jgi:hypothetical protein
MSSTVTTATVSTVTTAITMEGLGQALTLVAVVLLVVGLLAREVIVLSTGKRAKTWARGLDIGNAPLLAVFVLIAIINAAVYVQAR